MPALSKILVANRGEIACRILRTARAQGYRTVAVFSEADRDAPHVALADEAVCVGAAPASESYLSIERILAAAHTTHADSVHPGYGFLSENALFAAACEAHGLTFIGPPEAAIAAMGDKARAKARMLEARVPTAPAFLIGLETSVERLIEEAGRIGYPLLVKATAGGGGRGIRTVHKVEELSEAVASARREAESAFGDGTVMLEQLIQGGRHIEIQVLADQHGNIIHLGERDCTAQRRRQKVIEEAPSKIVDSALREQMGQAAIAAARAVGYRGVGTVELIVDERGNYFFLEMNTRLQVEHPVTELITGLDLVALQLSIASGEPLPLSQADVKLTGHAIEARLYAEDPYADFAPQTGTIVHFVPELACAQPGIRIDAGVTSGSVVSPHYDALLAKVIAHGPTRDAAIRKLMAALHDTPLFGLISNTRFLIDLLDSSDFRAARMTTTRIDEWSRAQAPLLQRPSVPDRVFLLAALLLVDAGDWFRTSGRANVALSLVAGAHRQEMQVACDGANIRVSWAGKSHTLRMIERSERSIRYELDGILARAHAFTQQGVVHIAVDAVTYVVSEASAFPSTSVHDDPTLLTAPLAGVVARLLVEPLATLSQGQPVLTIEAMKMETRVLAKADATLLKLHVKPGDQVEAGALLGELTLRSDEA